MSKITLTAEELKAAQQATDNLADKIHLLHQLASQGAELIPGEPYRPQRSAFRS
jgi:hypothetical protein